MGLTIWHQHEMPGVMCRRLEFIWELHKEGPLNGHHLYLMFGIFSSTLDVKYTRMLGTKVLKEGVPLFGVHSTLILAKN